MTTTFGEALRELRQRKGLSVRGLAKALGTSRSYVREIERGETRPSIARLTQLSHLLATDVEHLILLSGRIPADVIQKFQADPTLLDLVRNSHPR